MNNKKNDPKVLFFDIETSLMEVFTFGIWDQKILPEDVIEDWSVLSWAAMWKGDTEVMYQDNRNRKNIRDDKRLLKRIWTLLDQADIVVTQNGKKFDEKRLNARFKINGFPRPSSFKHIDTKQIASRNFAFTSNSLDSLTKDLNTKHKKLKHKKFPGKSLWKECLKNNIQAWEEMRIYNERDVLALEDLYNELAPWDIRAPNFNLYNDTLEIKCNCGSTEFKKNGFKYTDIGRYQRYKCLNCSKESRDIKNLFTKEKRQSLRRN